MKLLSVACLALFAEGQGNPRNARRPTRSPVTRTPTATRKPTTVKPTRFTFTCNDSCGTNKVRICHRPTFPDKATLCIPSTAVQAHFTQHGDICGRCPTAAPTTAPTAAPSKAPVTAAPSKAPITAVPTSTPSAASITATPSAAPSAKPTP